MKEHKNKRLRSGFTTGTAAAAAVKGALQLLLTDQRPETVYIPFLTEGGVTIPLQRLERPTNGKARCTVIKDAGDDPDVTHCAEIGAEVELIPRQGPAKTTGSVCITGGEGVGTVTKPGLEVPPGEPAINLGPRRMIRSAVKTVLGDQRGDFDVHVCIFVPRGKELARKTLNARLGILDGISILGTTGIVRPMSHEAYTATIQAALSVAAATGAEAVVFTTGRRSERFAQDGLSDMAKECFIQIGDYFQFSMEAASKKGFSCVVLAVFFGKALKMAQGIPHTHAARAALVLGKLVDWTRSTPGDAGAAEAVRTANTARQAFEILTNRAPDVISLVGRRIVDAAARFADRRLSVRSIIFDYDGRIAFDSILESDERAHG